MPSGRQFGRDTGDPDGHFPVHFLGVWDTVSSVGWVWEQAAFPFTRSNRSVEIVRHAVAIDERRAFFRQNLFGKVDGQDLKEHWFAGVHSDVGGGYAAEDGELGRCAFQWMLDEAKIAGLEIDERRRQKVLTGISEPPWADPQHESLSGLWHLAEWFPKKQGGGKGRYRCNRGRSRTIELRALIDRTTLLHIREAGYAPPNLSAQFIEEVRKLADVPNALPYWIAPKS